MRGLRDVRLGFQDPEISERFVGREVIVRLMTLSTAVSGMLGQDELGILRDDFFQQRFSGGVILLLDRALRLDEFRRGRGILDSDFVMADGPAGTLGLRRAGQGK